MPRKKTKLSVKTVPSTTIYPSSEKTPSVAIPFDRFGADIFHFWNGDVYEGEYWATTQKKFQEFHLFRDGYGEYRTADGQVYVCIEWRRDVMRPSAWVDVYFPDGGRYSGEIREAAYNGPGSYIFRDSSMLNCWWQDGRPKHLPIPTITDPYGRRWLALPQVQTQENDLCFVPPVRFLPVEPEDEEVMAEEAEGDIENSEEEEAVEEEEAMEPEVVTLVAPSRQHTSRRH